MNLVPEQIIEDVDVNTSEGLVTFSIYISEARDEINMASERGALSATRKQEAENLYRDLQLLIAHCREVINQGGQLADDDTEAMQTGYNHLLDISDQIGNHMSHSHSDSLASKSDSEDGSSKRQAGVSASVVPPSSLPMIPQESALAVKGPVSLPMVSSPQIHHGPLSAGEKESKKRLPTGPFSEIIDDLCSIPRYRSYVEKNYSSRNHFEARLKREVEKIEEQPLRGFYKVFGFQFANAFYSQLKDMTITEAVAFDDQPRAYVRGVLKEADIKYEVYVGWIDLLVEMLERTHAHKDMTVGELFVRNFIEEKIAEDTTN